jgi:DNA invertase Pin-like site-specific DNA recombinase
MATEGKTQMTVSAYVRVSSRRQKPDSQEAEIKKWLEGNGIAPEKVTWFLDKETGKTLDRPAFQRLQKAIFDGTVRTVIVWKLDRLSRRLRDGVNILADWCDRGLRVIVVTQQIDLGGAVGRMIAAVMLGLAEIELEFRRERQAAGIAVARKKGVYKGRAKGTTKARPHRARELRDQGLMVPEIATALGTSERTIWRYLNADTTTGSSSTTHKVNDVA